MISTIVNKKVTLPFAHEFEKSYEILVPRVSSWSEEYSKEVNVSASFMFSYHDETLELAFQILHEAIRMKRFWSCFKPGRECQE